MNPRPLFLMTLLATSAAAPVSGQVPPRRLYYGSTGQATPAAGGTAAAASDPQREADLRDGTVLPRGVRSLRIEREGEVIRQRPHVESPRRGTAARGARLPALEATQGHGCRGYWVRIGDEAWVCSDGGLTLSTDAPQTQQLPQVPEGQVVPYQYAFATRAGVRTYRRLDDIREDNWAEELERGMSVAVTGTEHIDEGTYVRTASGRWVALRDLSWARPSERAGIFYEPGETVASVAFLRADARAWPTVEEAARQRGAAVGNVAAPHAPRRDPHPRGAGLPRPAVRAGRRGLALGPPPPAPGGARGAGRPPPRRALARRRPRASGAHRVRGERPVFATLVSTGRAGNATAPGEHHVWVKLATTDMSNVDNVDLYSATSLYTVSRVPWVMFFHNDQALHGAFWHNGFGVVHSHGCVNLAPRDAAWLYSWAPPATPPGWTAVMPTARDPGLRVRVR